MSKKIIASYSKPSEALMAQSYLGSHGIETELLDQHIVSTNWFYSNLVGGVKLAVMPEDEEAAVSLLRSVEEGNSELPSDIVYGPTCPNCQSEHTELYNSQYKGLALLILFLTSVPLLFLNRETFVCTECGHKWTVKGNINWSAILGVATLAAILIYLIQ